MVDLIDRLAELTVEPLFTKEGKRSIGKQSWRSTGAVYFSNIGIEVLKIKMLARWESVTVTHYTRLAPLSTIAADFKRAVEDKKSKGKQPVDTKAIKDNIKKSVNEHVAKLEEELNTLADLTHQVRKEAVPKGYVRNKRTGVVHEILLRFDEAGQDAKTHCGWEYVMAKVGITLQADPPTKYKEICGTCMSERSELAKAAEAAEAAR